MLLIVPDNDTSREFAASDLVEAHGTCYARGYAKFDVWSMPDRRDPMLLNTNGDVVLYDDGARALQFDVTVQRP
jgi:hypothetical protein